MKNKYLLLIAFFIINILTAQTSLTFTADTAVDNGDNITETVTDNGVTYVLTASASVDTNLEDLGSGDFIFFANPDSELRPWIITLTADGSPINFTLTEIDYDTVETGSITITNQDGDVITPTTSYVTGAGIISVMNTVNATNISSFNVIPSGSDDLNDFGFHNIDITIPVTCTEPDVPTVTHTPTTVCSGGTASLNITGSLNDATAWNVYTGSCGGTLIGSTTSGTFPIPGTISTTTDYFVRGEGGCATPGSCGTVTITPTVDDASFTYDSATYTNADANPTPSITGLTGGTFSASSADLSIDGTSGEINLAATTPGSYTITYTTTGICPSSATFDITYSIQTFTWIGTTSNGWHTASNWDTNAVPHTTADVIIPAGLTNYPTITSAVTVNTINIASGASLIANASVSAQVTYSRNLPTTNWYLVGAPVSQDVIANHTFASGTGGNIGVAAFDNNDPTIPWVYSTLVSTGAIFPGFGVSMKLAAPGDVSITGNLITNNYDVPVNMGARNSFNLLGNPFPSYMNSATLAGDNSVIENATFWFWDGTQYVTHNNANPIDIAPAQGFFIETNANSLVTYNTSNQSHQSSDTFMRTEPNSNLELLISNGENSSSTKVFFIDGKTTGFDAGYDSKMFGGTEYDFAVFTELITENEGEKLAIQTLPTDNALAIPVGIIAKAGEEITFSTENLNLPEGTEVYLEDKTNNEFVNLSEGTYTTTLTEDINGVGQFYITTSAKSLSTIDENLDTVSIYKSAQNEVTISGLNSEASVTIYSLVGKQVVNATVNTTSNKVNLPSLNAGVYIVKLTSDLGEVTKKIILE